MPTEAKTLFERTGYVLKNPSRLTEGIYWRLLKPISLRISSRFRPGNVVMFHIGRSGSTVLGNMLNDRPDMLWDGEVYEHAIQHWESKGWSVDSEILPFEPYAHLRKQMIRAGSHFYGMEIRPFHLRTLKLPMAQFISDLRNMGYSHFIILRRKNILKAIISNVIAAQKHHFHQPATEKSVLTQITLDVANVAFLRGNAPLLSWLELHDKDLQTIDKLLKGLRVLQLTYEDDLEDDPFVAYQKVGEFIGVKPHQVQIKLGKTNPFPLRDILINFDEVQAALRSTPYEWMLNA